MPSDILGVSVFDPAEHLFHFRPGPVFTQILLADEINRASPRTQSALLEAMGESQVSVDGELRRLDELFFVIGTQNPIELHGTYPLPEAQMDRFALRFGLGYIGADAEAALLDDQRLASHWSRSQPAPTRPTSCTCARPCGRYASANRYAATSSRWWRRPAAPTAWRWAPARARR